LPPGKSGCKGAIKHTEFLIFIEETRRNCSLRRVSSFCHPSEGGFVLYVFLSLSAKTASVVLELNNPNANALRIPSTSLSPRFVFSSCISQMGQT
jgi:hypothetical protein